MPNYDNSSVLTPNRKKESIKLEPPSLYTVKFWNDDQTTYDFVAWVLVEVFQKNFDEAYEIADKIHLTGFATVGVFSADVAQTKVKRVQQEAQSEGFPFKCQKEPII